MTDQPIFTDTYMQALIDADTAYNDARSAAYSAAEQRRDAMRKARDAGIGPARIAQALGITPAAVHKNLAK